MSAESVTRHTASHWGTYRITVRDGDIVSVHPGDEDTCASPMIASLPAIVRSPLRIARPAIRAGWLRDRAEARHLRGRDDFIEVSWDHALDLVAAEMTRVRQAHGPASIYGGSLGWASAGRLHHAPSLLKRFLNLGGGFTDKIGNYSFGAAMALLPHVIGHGDVTATLSSWSTVVESTRLLVMFGGAALRNAQIESGGTHDHSAHRWLRRIQEAGVRIVNVSPVRDDVADFLGAEWIPIIPNTDAALMLAMAYVLVVEHRADHAFLDKYCSGHDAFIRYLLGTGDATPKTPEWAERITGVPASLIQDLARRTTATRSMVCASWSVQRGDHGEQPYWAAIALAACIGQIGLPGGGFGFGYAATDGTAAPRRSGLPRPRLPIGSNSVKTAIPAARIADLLLHPGDTIDFNGSRISYPDIRLVYWCGGNPFHHHQDLNRLVRAWRRPDTVIVHEPWWTPVAKFADIVLPCTTTLERNDIMASELGTRYVAMKQILAPVGGARDDLWIFADLASRLGYRDEFLEGRDEQGWLRSMYEIASDEAVRLGYRLPPFDTFWSAGSFQFDDAATPRLLLQDFRADPVANPLATPTGRIELWSERIASFRYPDCPPHPAWLAPAEWLGSPLARTYPLHLLTMQPATRLHSQMDSSPLSQASKIGGREPVYMNEKDGMERGLENGAVVKVFNARGACLAAVVLTDGIRQGVLQMATGAWYDPEAPGETGSMDKHGNPNVLTLDKGTSRLGQCSSAQTALVQVERWTGPLPPVSAYRVPRIVSADETS
ncbi:MAG: molybdopterin-dependent oxidoreductase [Lautropia sp.]